MGSNFAPAGVYCGVTRLWLMIATLVPTLSSAQVSGSFSMEKTVYAPGEPVFLSFTLHNDGKQPEEVHTSDPYSFCSDYKVRVRYENAPAAACYRGYGGSCMSGAIQLAPGQSRTERILLNYQNDVGGTLSVPIRLAGEYTVDAARSIGFAPRGGNSIFTAPEHTETRQSFHLRVDDRAELPAGVYAPFVEQLKSPDMELRREAARTLATLAPPALEPLLLTFGASKDYTLHEEAPLALANLGTKASLAALAQMLLQDQPGSYTNIKAAEYLGQTHDAAWFPLLLEVADQHGGMYLRHAAESGGGSAIPALLARLQSPSADIAINAIFALGNTGSRDAVPLLIDLLNVSVASETEIQRTQAVNASLRQLLHIYADPVSVADMASWRSRWQHWWFLSGATATIYKPRYGECVTDVKLP